MKITSKTVHITLDNDTSVGLAFSQNTRKADGRSTSHDEMAQLITDGF